MLPAYFWMFVFCIFMGFFCQLASFWEAHKERRDIISRMTDRQKWIADIHERYAKADPEEAEKIVDEVIEKLGLDKEDQ